MWNWNPNCVREAILRELEKEHIRREIIATEIARRRILEDDVRRELMLEREWAIRRNMGEELSLQERIAIGMSFPMMLPLNNNLPFQERMPFSGNSAMKMFPLPAAENQPVLETNKNKIIILDKPDPDRYRAKLKSLESHEVDGSEHSPFGLKKKPKDEWSCALCHVSTTCEKVFNEHLGGRKHKAKEAALKSQKISKSTSTSLLSKKSEKSMKPTETILISTSGLEAKAVDKDFVEITNKEQVVRKNQNAEASKKQNAKGLGVKKTIELKKNKSVMIWCEVCQVQVPSQAMETHKNGTKHRTRMLIFTKYKGSVPVSFTILSETTPLKKDIDTLNVLTEETNMKKTDNFANSDKPSVPPKTGQMGKPDYEREAILEDELRRELMLERELAMQRNMGKELSLEEQIGMQLSPSFPMMHPFNNLPLQERMAFPGNGPMNMFPLPQLPQVMAPEITPSFEINKDKSIILDKPDTDRFGAKRKALESPSVDDSEHSSFGLKEKSKDEWCCALCHVSATGFKGLNEHLQDMKHKAKEAALRIQNIGLVAKADKQLFQSKAALEGMIKAKEAAHGIQKIGKSTSTSLLSKKSEMSLKRTGTISFGLEAEADELPLQSEVALEGMTKAEEAAIEIQKIVFADEQSLQSKVPWEGKTNKVHDKDLVVIINEEQVVQKNQNAETSRKQNAKGLGVKKTVQLKKKKNAMFRCEICQVEVPARDFDTHKNGRKHTARLLIFTKNKGSVPVSSAVSSQTIPLIKDTGAANVLTKETNMKMADNFANPDKSSVSPVVEMLTSTKNEEIVPVSSTVSSETTPLTNATNAVNVLTKETNVKMAQFF